MKKRILSWIKILQHFSDRIWYAPLIGSLALLDNIILVIPNDGILVSSTMLQPKRWLYFAMAVTIGSTLGALALALLVNHFGLPFVMSFAPSLQQNSVWILTNEFFGRWGIWVVFFVALAPVLQQPAIVLAAAALIPVAEIVLAVFVGRLFKFLLMSYVASHAPKLIFRLWGMQAELKEVGLDPKHPNPEL